MPILSRPLGFLELLPDSPMRFSLVLSVFGQYLMVVQPPCLAIMRTIWSELMATLELLLGTAHVAQPPRLWLISRTIWSEWAHFGWSPLACKQRCVTEQLKTHQSERLDKTHSSPIDQWQNLNRIGCSLIPWWLEVESYELRLLISGYSAVEPGPDGQLVHL